MVYNFIACSSKTFLMVSFWFAPFTYPGDLLLQLAKVEHNAGLRQGQQGNRDVAAVEGTAANNPSNWPTKVRNSEAVEKFHSHLEKLPCLSTCWWDCYSKKIQQLLLLKVNKIKKNILKVLGFFCFFCNTVCWFAKGLLGQKLILLLGGPWRGKVWGRRTN